MKTSFRQRFAKVVGAIAVAAAMVFAVPAAVAGGGQGVTARGNLNPGVIPNMGHLYGDLAADWFQWALSFRKAEVPFFNPGGPVDASRGQQGHVWFLAGSNVGPTRRSAEVPTGVALFFPLANLNNEYPCPDPSFRPDTGESMEHFLVRTAQPYLQYMTGLFAEIDGVPVRNPEFYLATSPLFTIDADPALAQDPVWDPCITGTPQPAIAMGYWLLLPPFPPGRHTLHFGSTGWGQDVTYILNVKPPHGR